MFLRLKKVCATTALQLLAHQTVRLSNDLYGTHVVYTFELAK